MTTIAVLAPATALAAYALPLTPANIGDFQADGWNATPSLGIGPAQSIADIKGGKVKLTVLEGDPDMQHEDLGSNPNITRTSADPDNAEVSEHATATLGVIGANANNALGVRGIAPEAAITIDRPAPGETFAEAIARATAAMTTGDVYFIENMSGNDEMPVEAHSPATYDAIRRLVDRGVIVLEPGGNVGSDLDSAAAARFNSKPDSGAIIVGAGSPVGLPGCVPNDPALSRARYGVGANYGSRINVQGPGHCVPTTATYGEVGGVQSGYSPGFNGTSSAVAVMGGVTAALSSAYERSTGEPLMPEGARNALIETGAAQTAGAGDTNPPVKKVGPLPNLPAAFAFLKDAPATSIVSGPTGETASATPTFTFAGTPKAGTPYSSITRYECRFALATEHFPKFTPCGATGTFTPTTPLRYGAYSFQVRAVSEGTSGTVVRTNVDPTPASRDFVLNNGAGTVSVSAGTITVNAASATPDTDRIQVTEGPSTYTIFNSATIRASSPGGCTQLVKTAVSCPKASVTRVVVNAYGGTDSIDANVSVPTELNGGAGDDVLRGVGSARDDFNGGDGVDTVSYSGMTSSRKISLDGVANDGPFTGTADFVGTDVESGIGGSAADVMQGSSSTTWGGEFRGGDGNDTITGGPRTEMISGGAGVDVLKGGRAAYVVMSGGPGNDLISATASVAGPPGEVSWLHGGAGDDTIIGGAGNVEIRGGGGSDTMTGGTGSTLMIGGGGNDTFNGGTGTDTVSYAPRPDSVSVTLPATGPGTAVGTWAVGGTDTINASIEKFEGGMGSDTFTSSRAGIQSFSGQKGNDTLNSGAGSTAFDGGPGKDRTSFVARTSLVYLHPHASIPQGLTADFPVSSGTQESVALTDVESVRGTEFDDFMHPGMDDAADARGLTIDGGAGADNISGTFYNDSLMGGSGVDALNGWSGADTLYLIDGTADFAACSSTSTAFRDAIDEVNHVVNGTCG